MVVTLTSIYRSEESLPIQGIAPGIAAALQELVEGRIIEVLPSQQNIFLEWLEPSAPFQENIGQLVVARQLSYHPIAVATWGQRGDVMQPVSYSPCSLAFTFILYHPSHAGRAYCYG
jgi:hypothetical protein